MYDRTNNSGNNGLGREHALVFAYGDALEILGVMAQRTQYDSACGANDLRLYWPSCNILAYKQYY